MDLKFTFNGSSHDRGQNEHHHDDAHSGIPLPFAGASGSGPAAASNVLELRVSASGATVVCEGLSGDGVSYARAEKPVEDPAAPAALAPAVRSVLARAGASLPEPLIESVTGIVLALDGAEAAVLAELGLPLLEQADPAAPISAVDEALQARTGVAAGTPIRLAN